MIAAKLCLRIITILPEIAARGAADDCGRVFAGVLQSLPYDPPQSLKGAAPILRQPTQTLGVVLELKNKSERAEIVCVAPNQSENGKKGRSE